MDTVLPACFHDSWKYGWFALVGVDAAAVGFAAGHPAFHQAALADEADVQDPGLDALVVALGGAQPPLELLG